MDYFKVFLEAYSEHHGRKLKLLEGKELDPEAEKLATDAVNNAKDKKWVNVKDAPITTPSNKQLWVWETAAGKISYNTNPVPFPGSKGIDTPKKWSAFVAAFTVTGEQERTALIDDEERLPVPIQERIKNISKETKTKVANNFFHVEKQIVAVWDKLPKEIQDRYQNEDYFRNYFLGASHQSFENKLLSPKFTLELVNGEWASKPYELDEAQMSLISDSFKDLVDLVATGDGTNCDKNKKVLSNFSKSQNNDVIVRPQGDPNNVDALVFEDKTNFLKNLLTLAEDQCDGIQVDTDKIIEPPPLKNNSNNIRGTGFEDYELITSLEKIKKGLMALGKPTTHIDTLIAKKSKELAAKMSKLEENAEKVWLPGGIISALDPGVRQQTLDLASLVLLPLPPQQPNSIIKPPTSVARSKLLHQMARYGRSIRRPIVSLPVGDQTKDGKRQDTVEFYKTREEAVAAAARDGLVVEPDQGTVEDFFPQKSKDVLKALKADGVFKDDQKVWRLKVSLKSYMSLDHAKYGGGRDSTLHEVFTPNGKNEEQIATIKSNLGMDDASFEGVKGYAKEIAAISTTLDGAKVANTVIRNKKSTKVNTGTLVAETLLKKIKQDGNYKDLLSKGEHAEIINACETLVGDSTGQFTPAEKEGALSRIKILVKDRMQASRVRQDLASDNPEIKLKAQQYLAVKMFHAGGSDDDELICDYRGLGSKDNYIFKQNDPLRDAWASVRAGDGKWNLSMTQAGKVVLESKRMTDIDGKEVKGNSAEGQYPMRITMSSSVRSSKEKDRKPGDPASGYHSGYIVEVDRDTMEHYSRNSSKHLPEASEIVFLFGKLQSLMEKVTGRRL